MLTTLAKNNDPNSVDLLMQIACKPDIDVGVSDYTACEARNRLADIFKNSEPDSHRAGLIEQAAIAMYDQSYKQEKLPHDVLTFALHASLRGNDSDNVERIIDLLIPLDPLSVNEEIKVEPLSVVEQITAGNPIDSIDLNEDEDDLIEEFNAPKMGSKPIVSRQEPSLVSPMVGQLHPRGGISSGVDESLVDISKLTQVNLGSEKHLDTTQSDSRSVLSMGVEPLSGGIGGGELASVSELAQVSGLEQVSERSLVYVPSLKAEESHQQARLVYVDVVTSLLKTNQQSEDWFAKVMARWDRKNPVINFESVQNQPKKVMKSITLPGFGSESLQAKLAPQSVVNPSLPLSVKNSGVELGNHLNNVVDGTSLKKIETNNIQGDQAVEDPNETKDTKDTNMTIPNGSLLPGTVLRQILPEFIVSTYDWLTGNQKVS
ncbi:hypothetical protein [uncultured Shewanella sp.]|uniref:hypothetical protein n=1 Tax=uncultured Shewanella sp. TaxID=173975 RepID=UPI002628BDA3|nr:hypothetical protein [uncultured Shewanella sp.]